MEHTTPSYQDLGQGPEAPLIQGHLVQGPGHIPGPDHIDQGQGHHQCLADLVAEVGAGVTGDAVGQEVGVQVCLDVTKSDKDFERLKEPKK